MIVQTAWLMNHCLKQLGKHKDSQLYYVKLKMNSVSDQQMSPDTHTVARLGKANRPMYSLSYRARYIRSKRAEFSHTFK